MEGANTNLIGQYDSEASSAGRLFRTDGLRGSRQGKGVTCPPQWLPVLLATAPSSPPLEIVGGHASTTCAPASYCNRENTPSSTWSTLLYSTAPSGNGSLLNLMQPDDNVGGAIVRLSAVACVASHSMAGSVEIDLGEYCTLAAGNGFGCGASGCFQARSSVTCWGGRLASTQGYPTNNSDGYPGEPVSYPDYRSLDM